MALTKYQRAFSVFTNLLDAQNALEELKAAGYPMNQVSAIASNSDDIRGMATEKAHDATNAGAIAGGTIGGALGLAIGLGTAAVIPIVGPLALFGVAATALATTLTSGVMGAAVGSLIGALIDYGVPEPQARVYSDRINRGDYFVMAEGTEAEVRQAEAIMTRWNAQELRIYDVQRPSEVISVQR